MNNKQQIRLNDLINLLTILQSEPNQDLRLLMMEPLTTDIEEQIKHILKKMTKERK